MLPESLLGAGIAPSASAFTDLRAVDDVIPPGVSPDRCEQGWGHDDFPRLYRELIETADIVVLASPTWLGDRSSVRLLIERMYGWSGDPEPGYR